MDDVRKEPTRGFHRLSHVVLSPISPGGYLLPSVLIPFTCTPFTSRRAVSPSSGRPAGRRDTTREVYERGARLSSLLHSFRRPGAGPEGGTERGEKG